MTFAVNQILAASKAHLIAACLQKFVSHVLEAGLYKIMHFFRPIFNYSCHYKVDGIKAHYLQQPETGIKNFTF